MWRASATTFTLTTPTPSFNIYIIIQHLNHMHLPCLSSAIKINSFEIVSDEE